MCERYSSITAQIRSEEEQQAKLELVKRGLMHDLLTGKVEVPLAKDPGGTA
jgi:restriction endonuclease S subunit